MSQKSIVPTLLSALDRNDVVFSNIKEEEVKREVFQKVCESVYPDFDPQVSNNLRNIINILLLKGVRVDLLIEEISDMVKSNYMITLKEREEQDRFDAIHGTYTSQILEQFELKESIDVNRFINCTRYVPSPIKTTLETLDLFSSFAKCEEYVFIDVGSGLGRNLLLGSEYSFKKIIGIEISQYLHDKAVENIKIYKTDTQKCSDIKSLCIDAIDYVYPEQNLAILIHRPFNREISDPFMLKMIDFVKKRDLTFYLMFIDDPFPAILETDTFKLKKKIVSSVPFIRGERNYRISLFSNPRSL